MSSVCVDNSNTLESKSRKPLFFELLWNKYLSFIGVASCVKNASLFETVIPIPIKMQPPAVKPLTFTLHLPGLKKTVQFSYLPKEQDHQVGNTMKGNYMFKMFVCNTFDVVYRRAQLFKLHKGIASEVCYSKISDGDTLILVVRSTVNESENEYFNNQKESLMNNKYLQPSITKHQASSLLAEIKSQFNLFGHKNWLPGGTGYEYTEYYNKNVLNYPEV